MHASDPRSLIIPAAEAAHTLRGALECWALDDAAELTSANIRIEEECVYPCTSVDVQVVDYHQAELDIDIVVERLEPFEDRYFYETDYRSRHEYEHDTLLPVEYTLTPIGRFKISPVSDDWSAVRIVGRFAVTLEGR